MDGTWKNMFEKEIKKVKNRTTYLITLGKNDGDVKEGKCFIYYPHEIEEIQQYQTKYETLKGDYNNLKEKYTSTYQTSQSLEEELKSHRQTIEENKEKIESLKTQLKKLKDAQPDAAKLEREIETIKHDKKLLSNDYETQQKTLERLEDENSKKDEEIKQLKEDNSHLIEENSNLTTTNTTMKIKYDREVPDLIEKYNDCVDMIHSLISTTTLLKNDIEQMGFTKRTFGFKKNVDSLFEERNLDILIEQHLIGEEPTIPKKLPKKE